jgi:SpoVK/Ycf46/Vps4 family AAA+-type ATPase
VAPVPLDQYRRYMTAVRAVRQRPITRQDVRGAFSHLVLDDRVLDEIGPAVMSGHSMFIYGPPGNGKSAIARGIHSLLEGDLAIPHALEVEGQIVRVFDPVNHEAVSARAGTTGLASDITMDRRWVICRRPMLVVGGELTMDALDLAFEPSLGYYRAPLQVQANGGVLIVDDFGRQRAAPRELLNRWMVPLENGEDYLTLRSGMKFDVPFHVFVAFATNLRPADLVDEAFLRRVPYKVQAGDPSDESYIRIFENYCREQNVPFDRAIVQGLLGGFYRTRAVPRRACQPRDLINQALRLASYQDEPRQLTPALLEAACRDYFVSEES